MRLITYQTIAECITGTMMKLKYPTNREYYSTWHDMIRRCYDTRRPAYKDYGGRGIKVCDRWLNSLDNYASDIGERPTPKHTLDRIDNDGDYEPSNVRWVTRAQQNKNRRTYTTNKSGYSGVSWHSRESKWQVYGYRNGIRRWLGYANSLEQAGALQQMNNGDNLRGE